MSKGHDSESTKPVSKVTHSVIPLRDILEKANLWRQLKKKKVVAMVSRGEREQRIGRTHRIFRAVTNYSIGIL